MPDCWTPSWCLHSRPPGRTRRQRRRETISCSCRTGGNPSGPTRASGPVMANAPAGRILRGMLACLACTAARIKLGNDGMRRGFAPQGSGSAHVKRSSWSSSARHGWRAEVSQGGPGKHARRSRDEVTYQSGHWEGACRTSCQHPSVPREEDE